MKTTTTDSNTSPSTMTAFTEAANNIPAEAVVRTRIDPLAAKRACVTGLEFLDQFTPVIAKKYPGIDMAALRSLPALCDEYGNVQHATSGDHGLTTGEIRDLIEAGFEWRRKLMKIAEAMVLSGVIAPEALDPIRKGAGTADNLRDVGDLVKLLTPHRASIEALFGSKALSLADAAAKKALDSMGTVTRSTAETRGVADLRDRLGTMLVKGHDQLRTVVALMSSYREGAEIVGPLFVNARKGKGAAKPTVATEPAVPTTPDS